MELAAAYATLANQGLRVEPYLIERITARDGTVLEQHVPQASQVVQPEVAYVLTHMMRGVIDRGTAGSAANLASTSPARPAPPTTTPTPGSSATRRATRS